MRKYPALSTPDGEPDPASYHRFFDPFYRGAFDAGRQVRIVHIRQLHDGRGEREGVSREEAARRHPVLVVPALYLAGDSTLDWLAEYARAGGHLVLGPRTGYADHEARARHGTAPGRLVDVAGVWYDEFGNLGEDIPLKPVPGSPLELPPGRGGDALGRRADGPRRAGAGMAPSLGPWDVRVFVERPNAPGGYRRTDASVTFTPR